MSIDTSFDIQPPATDTDDEQSIDAAPTLDPTTPTATVKPAPQVQHADGGLPAIPLLVITSNTTAAGLSAAAVVGGPLAAMGVAAAAVVTATAVSARSRQKARTAARRTMPKPAPKKPTGGTGGRSGSGAGARRGSTGGTRTGSGSRTGGAGRASGGRAAKKMANASTGTRTAPKKTTGLGGKPSAGSTKANTGAGRKSSAGKGAAGAAKKTTTTGGKGRVGQIKELRAAKKAEGKTRKQQREQATHTRRALKDGRRGEKAALKNLKKQTRSDAKNNPAHKHGKPGKASLGVSLRKAAGKHSAKARDKARLVKDKQALTRGQRIKQGRRNAKARAVTARKILSSRARYGIKAAGAALLTAPIGILGALLTPLGRKLGWAWLQHPGRRMYRRLTANAKYNHQARVEDAKNTHAHNTDPESLEISPIAAEVPRAPRTATTTLTGVPAMSELQFHFNESAQDMETAAAAYEPGGMMHVYQTIQGMPAGIQSWANTFKILAEKSDEVFPLDDQVGEGLSEVFELLKKAAEAAEEVQQTFKEKHESDIERLENPRKSLEAEKDWDVSNNEDYI